MKSIPRQNTHTADVYSHLDWFGMVCMMHLHFTLYNMKKKKCTVSCSSGSRSMLFAQLHNVIAYEFHFGERKNAPAHKHTQSIRNETGRMAKEKRQKETKPNETMCRFAQKGFMQFSDTIENLNRNKRRTNSN